MNKATMNEASFSEIEREKAKIARVFQLPPIERIQSLQASISKDKDYGTVMRKGLPTGKSQDKLSTSQLSLAGGRNRGIDAFKFQVPVLSSVKKSSRIALKNELKTEI